MKKLATMALIVLAGFILFSSKSSVTEPANQTKADAAFVIPDDVMAVIDQSCYGCHNSESKNKDASKALEFDKLGSLKNFVLISILEDIHKEVDSLKMPPQKFLERYPERALTGEQKALLMSWASETADNLTGK